MAAVTENSQIPDVTKWSQVVPPRDGPNFFPSGPVDTHPTTNPALSIRTPQIGTPERNSNCTFGVKRVLGRERPVYEKKDNIIKISVDIIEHGYS